jgi:uncharacterized membrane protein
MSNRKVALTILAVLMVQISVPMIPVDAATSGRSSHNFDVTVFTLSAGGSINDGTVATPDYKLAPGDHITRVVVANTGTSDEGGTLKLVHKASASSPEIEVTSIDIPSISAGGSTNPILINWTALSGDGQILTARIISTGDTNPADDEESLEFDVTILHRGTVLGDNIPGPSGGFSDLRLDHSIHTFEATVRNDGVMDVSAVFELNLTDNSDPTNKISYWSNTLILEPGNLLNPPTGGALSASFDAASLLGSWTLAAKVHFNGTLWTNTIVSNVETITFSDFIIDVSTPGDRSIEPGATTSLTWIITNLGSADDLTIELGSDKGWHDNSRNGQIINLGAGETVTEVISVTVPIDAVKPTLENIYLNLSSASTDPYTARSVAHVTVGDQYQASVIAPIGPLTVTPAKTESLLFTIINSGNVATAFTLDAGLSSSADNWQVSPMSSTDVIAVGENVTVTVFVTPAPISSPLITSERNGAGDSLYAWLSAEPLNGGVPEINTTQLIVRAVIAVDPGPETEEIILTESEIREGVGAGGVDKIISLSVEVRHNLGAAISVGVDANITVGNATFTPTNTGGNQEFERWNSSVTPDTVSALGIGEVFQSWLQIDGPSDEMPLAGELLLPVTATPILTSSQQSNGVLPYPVTRNISIIIPSITDGEIVIPAEPLDADVGNLTNFTIQLENTGNDLSSYRLVIEDDLPDLWSASLETSDLTSPSVVANLSAAMADHPTTGDAHFSNVTLKVTTDPQADADTLQALHIRVEDRESGEILSLNTLLIRVEESVNFELIPTNHTIDLSPYETPLTRVYVNNTGNVATTFLVWLDTSLQNDVAFTSESAAEIIVAPGYTESIKIRLTPDTEASADEIHMATLWVSASNGMNLSAVIVANITADHHLSINVLNTITVTPGVNEVIDVTFENTGNLEESLNITAVVEGGWDTSWAQSEIILPINGSLVNDLTVMVPALGGNDSLANGDLHNVTISLYHTANGGFLSSRTITLVVAPVFLVQVDDWPEEMLYHRQWPGDWRVTVTNVGNKDVTVDLEYKILKPGFDPLDEIPSLAWEIGENATNKIILPMGVPVELRFTVDAKEYEPDIYLEALLRLEMTPDDPEVTGKSIAETALKMSRLFPYEDYKLIPSLDNSNLTEIITWSHIPEGISTDAAYLIEICNAERRVNISELGLDEANFAWNFGLDVGGSVEILNLENNCDGNTHSTISLPSRESWVTINPIGVVIDTPNRPNILQNDGYDLTFRLYHPDDNNGFEDYTEATFSFYFATVADPVIQKLEFGEGDLQEGDTSTIKATIRNEGTSLALGVTLELMCEGVSISEPTYEYGFLSASEEFTHEFQIETDELDWWSQSTDVDCELILDARSWNGTTLDSKSQDIKGTVDSWSPNIGVSFIAMLVLMGASIVLLRLVGQNDKFRLAAIYSGVLALGFAFHLLEMAWWGPVVLLTAALWVWTMTWRSTVEFQLIHEDYQRARKGISTLYSDHFDVLSDSKRQLSIILAMPVLGMIGVILGFPPQINADSSNMLTLVGYLATVIVGVVFIIWNANRMYGSLYGRLTEIEVQASRIERDLGDPARLLTELASDGLDISSIISQPRPNVAAEGSASTSEVTGWDENILLDDGLEEDSVSEVLSFDDAEEDGSEQSLSIDIEDLFADDSSETDAEEVKGDD